MDSPKANEVDLAERDASYEHGPTFNFEFQANQVKLEIPKDQIYNGWKMTRCNPPVVNFTIKV